MRCYFMKNGHIQAVEDLPGLADEQAIEQSRGLFATKPKGQFDGFEVWDRARMVIQWPPPDAVTSNSAARTDPVFSVKPPSPFQDDAG